MPLLDHFHAPLYPARPWESFHSAWCTTLMEQFNTTLPPRYFAAAHVHLGAQVEADVAEFEMSESPLASLSNGPAGGVAVATWAPPAATVVLPADFPDDIEVQVMDTRDGAVLVGVIELVSPSNKDRDTARDAFVAKCIAYLQRGVGLVVVDIVTSRLSNLHNALIERLGQSAGAMADDQSIYVTSYRPARRQSRNLIDAWLYPLDVGQTLPTVPLALRGAGCLPVDLEASYTNARRASRL